MDERTTGIYIHIPFCVKKCNYCAFLSAPADEETREKYVQALIKEIEIIGEDVGIGKIGNGKGEFEEGETEECKVNFTSKKAINTIYFGGGTPSLLTPEQIGRIIAAIRSNFTIAPDAEITLEANPGTLQGGRSFADNLSEEEKLADENAKFADVKFTLHSYRAVGINRLSMGVQSLNDDVLKYIGRIHTAEDVRRDYRAARASGYDNINLDLILSLPFNTNQTGALRAPHNSKTSQEQSLEDLREILAMHPEHISCYSLQIEEGTVFGKLYDQGLLNEISDEEDRDTYHKICKALRDAGYEHYEISNWAYIGKDAGASGSAGLSRSQAEFSSGSAGLSRSPYRSRHNSSYWNMSDYIGLGLGASGFVGSVRYRNTGDLNKYIDTLTANQNVCTNNPGAGITNSFSGNSYKAVSAIREEVHHNTIHDNISEAVFTGLRRREGIRYADAVQYLASNADASHASDSTNQRSSLHASDSTAGAELAFARFWQYYADVRDEAESFVHSGHLIIDDEGMRLTEAGIDISNAIMALFV